MKRSQQWANKKLLRFSALFIATVALGAGLYTAYAFNQNLPGGLDVEAGGGPSAQANMELHLKYLDAAKVTDNIMSAYYPSNDSSANGKSIKITAGPQGQVCNIDTAALNGRIRITIQISGNQAEYNIPISEVCGSGSKFYGEEFAFPNGTLIYDSFANRYKANITVNYKITDDEIPASKRSDLNYKISITGNNSGEGKLALRKSAAATLFGMRSSYSDDPSQAPNNTLRMAIPFGYHCSVNVDAQADRQVQLYDADTVFGDTYMWVEKDDNKLPYEAYGATSRVDRWIAADRRWKLAGSNDNENVLTIRKEYIERGAKYELVMANPGTNIDGVGGAYNSYPVHWNTLSVGIPQDSIYSQGNCAYELRPTISRDQDAYVYYPNIGVSSSMTKTGGGPIPESHAWQIFAVRFAGAPSTTDLRNDANDEAPCGGNVMPAGATGCQLISSASYSGGESHSTQYTGGGPDAVGTRLCFFARVQNPTHWAGDDDLWNYSDMVCSISTKKPRVQFLGSDLRVGGNVNSTYYTVQSNKYGSWVEYGAFVAGVNSFLTSGNGLRGGSNQADSALSRLTFANTPTTGGYSPLPTPSSAYTYFRGLPATTNPFNQGNPTTGVYDFTGANLGAMSLNSNGQSVIIRKTGTLSINNNITVANNNVSGARNLSQIVIVADNIDIGQGVDRIDAWLITSPAGRINTCDIGAAVLTSNICNNLLTVNGPIYTNRLMLRRTAGANPPGPDQLSQPAERFNLRPDAQLWAYTYANRADFARTDFVQELPPRY